MRSDIMLVYLTQCQYFVEGDYDNDEAYFECVKCHVSNDIDLYKNM